MTMVIKLSQSLFASFAQSADHRQQCITKINYPITFIILIYSISHQQNTNDRQFTFHVCTLVGANEIKVVCLTVAL